MSLTIAQLITQARERLDDKVEPYLWSDTELYLFLDLAQKRFVKKTDMLRTGTICTTITVPIAEDYEFVTFDDSILRIRSASLESDSRTIRVINANEVEEYGIETDYGVSLTGAWRTRTGTPEYLVCDIDEGKGRVIPIPTADDTLQLVVDRLPIKDITVGGDPDALEIRDDDHRFGLIDWVAHLAYKKDDVETFDPDKSEKARMSFEAMCMEAKYEIRRRRRAVGNVRYGGY